MLHFSHKWKESGNTDLVHRNLCRIFLNFRWKFLWLLLSYNSLLEKSQIRDDHRRNCSTRIFGTKLINILCKITYWKSNVTEFWQKNYGKLRGLLGLGRGYVGMWGGMRIIFRIWCFPIYLYIDSKIILQSSIFGRG